MSQPLHQCFLMISCSHVLTNILSYVASQMITSQVILCIAKCVVVNHNAQYASDKFSDLNLIGLVSFEDRYRLHMEKQIFI